MLLDSLDLSAAAFHEATGWEIKPEGACKGEHCVPLPNGFDLVDTANRLGMALVNDGSNPNRWALGPESLTGTALVSAVAPDLELEDVDGNSFSLASLRGEKVILVAWAPY